MNDKIGIIINRLTIGFIFAFIYQMIIGAATSLIGISLTGDIEDLFIGLSDHDSEEGVILMVWWVLSTIIISSVALFLVRFKKFFSPYRKEKNIDIPPKITAITAIIIGAAISFLFFATDLVIGLFVETGSATDVLAIYESAMLGNFTPLVISMLFSIVAGFIVVGVASKAEKVKQITRNIGLSDITGFNRLVKQSDDGITHTADTAGLDPDALVHVGKKKLDKVKLSVIRYSADTYDRLPDTTLEKCLQDMDDKTITWINVSGIHDAETIRGFGQRFLLHPLTQSDIMNTELRPRINFDSGHIFVILKIPTLSESGSLSIEQISLVIGKGFVLTFQETDVDIFDPIRERLKEAVGSIRSRGSDYLGYAIVDSIVDHFFVVLEKLGEVTETIEEELMDKPGPNTLEVVHQLKRQMIVLRKSIWPLREVIDTMERRESAIIQQETRTYIRDAYNHTVQVMDTIEGLRDMVGGMLDTYLSSVSNKMNEVMKTLTIIASIFIPITFIAGLYGTNFAYVPELEWEWSYFVMIGGMIVVVIAMVAGFKRKGWM